MSSNNLTDVAHPDETDGEKHEHRPMHIALISVSCIFIVLVTVIVSLRIFIRAKVLHHFGADDILLVCATICFLGLTGVVLNSTYHGLGYHLDDLPNLTFDKILYIVRSNLPVSFLYPAAISLTKIGVIVTYLRIFPQRWFRIMMWVTMGVVIALWVFSIFISLFVCSPVGSGWRTNLRNEECQVIFEYGIVAAAVNMITDFIVSALPIPLIWKLNIARKERAILCALLGIGFSATVISAMRLATMIDLLHSFDFSHSLARPFLLSIIETGLAIIAAALPAMNQASRRVSVQSSKWTFNSTFHSTFRRGTASTIPELPSRSSSGQTYLTGADQSDNTPSCTCGENEKAEAQ